MRMPQEELQNALRRINELEARKRELGEKLLLARAGKRDTGPAKQKVAKYMVVGDSILRKVVAEHADMKVQCCQAVLTE